MEKLNASNNAETQLLYDINENDTSLQVRDADIFPKPPFLVSINHEIIKVNSVDGNTFSGLERGREGTTPAKHKAGDFIENRFTAGMYNSVVSAVSVLSQDLDAHKAETMYLVNNTMTQTEIQEVLDTHLNVRFLPGIYSVEFDDDNIGYRISSNQTVSFDGGAILKAQPYDHGKYSILHLQNINNTTINRPQIIGERDDHIGDSGEWGMGIHIENVNGVVINQPSVKDCWGDGIYVGNNVQNTTINEPICDNNRRQGISVVSGRNVYINNPVCINTNGTSPESGIDIEPNDDVSYMNNIVINNPYTENNNGGGIICSLRQLANKGFYTSIEIINHRDVGSGYGFGSHYSINCEGVVKNSSPIYCNNKGSALFFDEHGASGVKTLVNSPTIINPQTNGNGISPKYSSAITVIRDDNRVSSYAMGNIEITDITFEDVDNEKNYALFALYDHRTDVDIRDIIVDFKKLPNTPNRQVYTTHSGLEITGVIRTISLDSLHGVFNSTEFVKRFVNGNDVETRRVEVSKNAKIGAKIMVENRKIYRTNIAMPENNNVIGFNLDRDNYFHTTQDGSRVTIEKISDVDWVVTDIVGNWGS